MQYKFTHNVLSDRIMYFFPEKKFIVFIIHYLLFFLILQEPEFMPLPNGSDTIITMAKKPQFGA